MSETDLHPRFYQPPPNLPLLPEQKFWITGYARVDDWTLVKGRLNFGSDGPNGDHVLCEMLYRGNTMVACDHLNGEIRLYAPQVIQEGVLSATPETQPSVWDRIDSKVGENGMPPAIAVQLRDPKYWRWLDSSDEAFEE